MSIRKGVVILCALFFSTCAGGCSIMFMDTVPMQWSPSQDLKCSGYTMPIIDGTVAAVFTASFTYGVVQLAEDYDPGVMGIAIGMLVPVAVYVTSAVFGCIWAGDCDRAEDAQKKWSVMGPLDRELFDDHWREERGVAPAEGEP
jgi:hypothetical protein